MSTERQNLYLDYFIDPGFQGVNRLFALSFEDNVVRNGHRRYFLPTLEIKDYNVMTDGKNSFDHPVNNDLRTYDNIQKVSTG